MSAASATDAKFWRTKFLEAYKQYIPFKNLDRIVGNPSANFQRVVAHPMVDDYYDAMVPTREQFTKIILPILTITGQYDGDELGALTYYRDHLAAVSAEIKAKHFLIIGPWEVSTADLFDTVRNVPFGFKLGELHFSLRAMLAAAVALALILIVTRAVQRWLETELLPRTAIEPSLQLSIVTIFGYIGAIAAITLALTGLGVDLQKIALIAGALSVGIGFGFRGDVGDLNLERLAGSTASGGWTSGCRTTTSTPSDEQQRRRDEQYRRNQFRPHV